MLILDIECQWVTSDELADSTAPSRVLPEICLKTLLGHATEAIKGTTALQTFTTCEVIDKFKSIEWNPRNEDHANNTVDEKHWSTLGRPRQAPVACEKRRLILKMFIEFFILMWCFQGVFWPLNYIITLHFVALTCLTVHLSDILDPLRLRGTI